MNNVKIKRKLIIAGCQENLRVMCHQTHLLGVAVSQLKLNMGNCLFWELRLRDKRGQKLETFFPLKRDWMLVVSGENQICFQGDFS